jgi:hypothetical protein
MFIYVTRGSIIPVTLPLERSVLVSEHANKVVVVGHNQRPLYIFLQFYNW